MWETKKGIFIKSKPAISQQLCAWPGYMIYEKKWHHHRGSHTRNYHYWKKKSIQQHSPNSKICLFKLWRGEGRGRLAYLSLYCRKCACQAFIKWPERFQWECPNTFSCAMSNFPVMYSWKLNLLKNDLDIS